LRRRSWLQRAAAALSSLSGWRAPAWAEPPDSSTAPESRETLVALATTVLPASLGRKRILEVTARFEAWLGAYRPGAELDHGYGHTKLQTAAGSPASGHELQLAALERSARAEGSSFANLSYERRRALVISAVDAARIAGLPERPDGRHVATDLLAFFFRSSDANDLCYQAAIGRDTCRGLAGSEAEPRRSSTPS
jgi:hypothetical protein